MQREKTSYSTTRVTPKEIKEIRDDVADENDYRRSQGLPEFDTEAWVREEIRDYEHWEFEELLRPYVKALYDEIEGVPGIPGRIVQHLDVYKLAEAQLREE
ncbi:MAG: hypothetical protein AAF198_02835 [Pseudomonadota bacterium]